jgi:hypothetical protein
MASTNQTNLAGVTSGMFKVTTEGSSYIIDFDNKRAKRNPGTGAPELRRDNQWFNFMSVAAEVGGPMFIWTSDIAGEFDDLTNRRTSPVTRIECLIECGL